MAEVVATVPLESVLVVVPDVEYREDSVTVVPSVPEVMSVVKNETVVVSVEDVSDDDVPLVVYEVEYSLLVVPVLEVSDVDVPEVDVVWDEYSVVVPVLLVVVAPELDVTVDVVMLVDQLLLSSVLVVWVVLEVVPLSLVVS